ncbi:MAG: hypothetical protein ACYS91_05455 [Planctomycetota bacterium]
MAKENKGIKVDETCNRRTKQEIIVLEKTPLLPMGVHEEKVIAIRQQLAEGKYDINHRLNAAIDKILENLARNNRPEILLLHTPSKCVRRKRKHHRFKIGRL